MEKFVDSMIARVNQQLRLNEVPVRIYYVDEEDKARCQFKIPDEVGYLENPVLNPTEKLTDLVRDIFYHLYGKKLEFNNYNTIFWIKEELLYATNCN